MSMKTIALSLRHLLFDFRLSTLWRSKLTRAGSGLVVAGILGGILGYAFQIAMGRLLSPVNYGQLNALMSLLMILAVPLGTVSMVNTRYFSEYRASGDQPTLTALYWRTHRQVALAGTVGALLLLMLVPWLQSYLHVSSLHSILWFIGVLFFSLFPLLSYSLLQGVQDFRWLALAGLQQNLSKFLIPLLLVGCFGLGLNGSLAGLALSALLSWIIAFLLARRHLTTKVKAVIKPVKRWSSLPVLLANICFAAMTQMDMALVNFYFPGESSGNYAAAAVLGKIVLYLPGGILAVLFPMVAENKIRGHRSMHLLGTAVLLTSLIAGAVALCFYLLADSLVTLSFGHKYDNAPEILRYFGFAMLPIALILVAEYFLIARGKILFTYLLLAAMPLQILVIHFHHSHLLNVVAAITVSSLLVTIVGYYLMWRDYRTQHG